MLRWTWCLSVCLLADLGTVSSSGWCRRTPALQLGVSELLKGRSFLTVLGVGGLCSLSVHGLIFWGPSVSHMVAEGCLSHGPWLACSLEGMYCSSSPAFLTLREHQPLWRTKCSRPWPLWWPRWGHLQVTCWVMAVFGTWIARSR